MVHLKNKDTFVFTGERYTSVIFQEKKKKKNCVAGAVGNEM